MKQRKAKILQVNSYDATETVVDETGEVHYLRGIMRSHSKEGDQGIVEYRCYGSLAGWFFVKEQHPLCFCGKPVNLSNPDCVSFGLCEEHELDA